MALNNPIDVIDALPQQLPVFPLAGGLLLPRTELPLNIFEPRYLDLVDAVLASERCIAVVQPVVHDTDKSLHRTGDSSSIPPLHSVGCVGRLTALQETGDGRYLITLSGICRFKVVQEVVTSRPFRMVDVDFKGFENDLVSRFGEEKVDRVKLLSTFAAWLEAHELSTDWKDVERANNEMLVNALSVMAPFGVREKQALLEAPDLAARADILIAITEMQLASEGVALSHAVHKSTLQ